VFDHVTIRVSDLEASVGFYRTVLGRDPTGGEFLEWDAFSIAPAKHDRPATRNLHVGFAAASRVEVDAFWRRGVEGGYESDGDPGPRPQYTPDYYGAFLLDPDGNSIEAVHRSPRTESGPSIDHLWLGVADLEASRRFWETVAPVLGLEVEDSRLPGLVVVASGQRHLMLVPGRAPTEHLHLAFPVEADEAVAEFHRAAAEAGYQENLAAFVLDPSRNTIEAVNHNR
jgi:catechol 2,3-dioxygenase-like lactoylglutathione lyase family enzyme